MTYFRTRDMLVARAALRTAHGVPSGRALRRARECRARIAFSASASSSADDAASAGSATFVATSLASTERIARALARDARVGDVVCLHGDVGAGKSVLSRAFVRAVARDPTMEVPSPTFLLQQVYDDHDASFGPAVHHFDLYRCGSVAETVKLDLPGSFATAASLIEWAERLDTHTAPADRLDVYLRICGGGDARGERRGAVVVDDEARRRGGGRGGRGRRRRSRVPGRAASRRAARGEGRGVAGQSRRAGEARW